MKTITLRPADVGRDFSPLAVLFTLEQDEPTSEKGLLEDYRQHLARIFRLVVAEDERGQVMGFNWGTISRFDPHEAYFYVIVWPQQRGQGAGSCLYADLEQAARVAGVTRLEVSVRDDCPPHRAFADRLGFSERMHTFGMALELTALDDRPYDEIIARLQAEGFQFTSMEELGNSEAAQRKLFALNDTAAAETLGSDGRHSWLSFEDFREKVCQSSWFNPAGQLVVIDRATGEWAAMSAITRFEGVDYAYNLFTGVDKRYRGRKLAQAVKVLALRYARDVLGVKRVQTHHNAFNLPMIAIDRKLGYVQTPGYYTLVKTLA